MWNGWLGHLQETIEWNVDAILSGNGFNYDFSNGEHDTDLFIIYELFRHGKKREALHLIDELGTDGLSHAEMQFLGLLLVRQQEYDRALAFLAYVIINNSKKEIEVLEGFLSCFKYQSIQQGKDTEWEDSRNPVTSIEFFIDPKPICKLYHEPLLCDFLDILRGYQADFENGIISEKESNKIYGFIAEYYIWGTGNLQVASEYCEKGLKAGDLDNYKLLGDIALIAKDPIYAIAAYEQGFKWGDAHCLLGIADGMGQLNELKKQENYIRRAIEYSVPGARKKLFAYYITQEKSLSSAWEEFQYLIEKERYIPTLEEVNTMQSYQQRLLGNAASEEDIKGVLSAYRALGIHCLHSGYQVAYWQQIYTIIYSEHQHLDTLTQSIEKIWKDQIPLDDTDEKTIFYSMLLAEMEVFKNFCNDRGEFEYMNYQIFWEICEYFQDPENAAWYYSLYLQSNPGLPRTETIYYERYIDNRENKTYTQGMTYKH